MASADKRFCFLVVVLGDVGRSPRMQYHVLSMLEEGHHVTLVGYVGEDLIPALHNYPDRLRVVRFSLPALTVLSRFRALYFLWRIVSISLWLLFVLLIRVPFYKHVDCILVQNPPALPLLLIAYLTCVIKGFCSARRPALVIDWHNLGYSMLPSGAFQQLARIYEKVLAPWADGHLCVTMAMKAFLQKEMSVSKNIRVLYDCPPSMFRPLSAAGQHQVLRKVNAALCSVCPSSWSALSHPSKQTLFTHQMTEECGHRHGRPALVTTSTSWTADEDFDLLLDALQILDQTITSEELNLKVVVAVTGKGPLKETYEKKMSKLGMVNVAIKTLWLEPADYPRLLACADVGISLHTSTSGLDLPMKVLDLFGCQVPVCALRFSCLNELVKDNVNGCIFGTSGELAEQLRNLLSPLCSHPAASPHSFGNLGTYSDNLKERKRWKENWVENALPVLIKAAR